MAEASALLQSCSVIYLHAPGMNRQSFMASTGTLAKHSDKVKSIQFGNKKANHTEATEISKRLTTVTLIFNIKGVQDGTQNL